MEYLIGMFVGALCTLSFMVGRQLKREVDDLTSGRLDVREQSNQVP